MVLSHIIATNLDTMIALVDSVREEEELLDQLLKDYGSTVSAEDAANYEQIVSDYENLKYAIVTLFGYSAAGNNKAAFELLTERSRSTPTAFRKPFPP